MSATLAPSVAVDRPSRLPVRPRVEDRWSFGRPSAKRPALILWTVVASLACHALVVATLLVTNRPPLPPQPHEISVEIVPDVPKPPPPAPAPAPKQQAAKLEAPKAETPKPDTAKPPPAPPKVEQPKVEAPKPQPPKAEPPKRELARQEPPTQEPAKPDLPKPDLPKPDPARARPAAAEADQLAELQKELADLKAQHAELERREAAESDPSGDNSLAKSFQAIALPETGDGIGGEAVSYKELVFSQLAKAKGIGPEQGRPGTTAVRFAIDETGALVSVEIATPSGVAALDAEALAIVRRAAPFPPPPKEAGHQFFANVTFVPRAQ